MGSRKIYLANEWLESAVADGSEERPLVRRNWPNVPQQFMNELHDMLYMFHYEARDLVRSTDWPKSGLTTADVESVVKALRSLDRNEFAILTFFCHQIPQKEGARILRMKKERYKKTLQRLKMRLPSFAIRKKSVLFLRMMKLYQICFFNAIARIAISKAVSERRFTHAKSCCRIGNGHFALEDGIG